MTVFWMQSVVMNPVMNSVAVHVSSQVEVHAKKSYSWWKMTGLTVIVSMCYVLFGYITTWFWVRGNMKETDYNPFTLSHFVGSIYAALWASFVYFIIEHYCGAIHGARTFPTTQGQKLRNRKCWLYTGILIVHLITLARCYELVFYVYSK